MRLTEEAGKPLANTLIVLEGADGTGKTTQMELLSTWLTEVGYQVHKFDLPSKTGEPVGNLIGGYLRGEFGVVPPKFLSLAFTLDRAIQRDAMHAKIKFSDTSVVLSDRWVTANLAFQSSKLPDEERADWLSAQHELEFDTLEVPHPDLEIFLVTNDLDMGKLLERKRQQVRDYTDKPDVHEMDMGLQMRVNRFYRDYNAPFPTISVHIFVTDADGELLAIDKIHERIKAEVIHASFAIARMRGIESVEYARLLRIEERRMMFRTGKRGLLMLLVGAGLALALGKTMSYMGWW